MSQELKYASKVAIGEANWGAKVGVGAREEGAKTLRVDLNTIFKGAWLALQQALMTYSTPRLAAGSDEKQIRRETAKGWRFRL